MPNDSANGTTMSFGGVLIGKLISIGKDVSSNEMDVTNLASALHVFLRGIPSVEWSFELFGVPAIAEGSTGTVSIAWNDGSTDTSSTTYLCTKCNMTGAVDAPRKYSITLKPYGGA